MHHAQMISCLDCRGEELFITQVGLRGLHTKYLKITLARQNLSQSHKQWLEERDRKDLNCVETLTKVMAARDKADSSVTESRAFPATAA